MQPEEVISRLAKAYEKFEQPEVADVLKAWLKHHHGLPK